MYRVQIIETDYTTFPFKTVVVKEWKPCLFISQIRADFPGHPARAEAEEMQRGCRNRNISFSVRISTNVHASKNDGYYSHDIVEDSQRGNHA